MGTVMGAMKRLIDTVYETLQETEGFRVLGMDQQFSAAIEIASDVLAAGPVKNIHEQILHIGQRRGYGINSERF
jgi:hypothetical protein